MRPYILLAASVAAVVGCAQEARTLEERFTDPSPPTGVLTEPLSLGALHALCGTPAIPCQDPAHATHAAYMWRDASGPNSGRCNNCHVGVWPLGWFTSEFDPDGNRRPAFIAPTAANPNPPKPSANGWTGTNGPKTCSNVACHGVAEQTFTWTFQGGDGSAVSRSAVGGGSYKETPLWSSTVKACDTCHALPPRNGPWHLNHANGTFAGANECSTCHPNVSGTIAGGLGIVDPSLHGNGVVEVQPSFRGVCFGCH